ncbi:MAG: protein with DOMON-like ligand-binding domain protein, partial [Ignavibacteriae bacterium]|nr:protein with DOMON-like ligand-binding domain protein [Ignavibacteriota bacterium]
QTWGVQFHRHFRTTREQFTWNPIDVTKGNIGLYHGEVHGINNIEPPTRLSFYPFSSGLVKTLDGETEEDFSFGMDVKYGISENFTLDATLIPDFSQVGFDNVRLNLSPFEQQFSEQRQFFTEGIELFTKGNLFYSRRIGNRPSKFFDVEDDLEANEEIKDNPNEAKTLNAIKVSGRTKKGLGIGVFNAVTQKTEATIRDTITNESRKFMTEPLTNYSILVLDQQFNKNSSITVINTNVTRNGHFRDANVFGAGFDITDKNNKFNYEGAAIFSSVNLEDGTKNGFTTNVEFSKVSGKYRYSFEHELADRNFDKNDFGIQRRNNYNNFEFDASYRIFEPTEKFNNFRINAWFNYNRLYKPSRYTRKNIGININAETKKHLWFGGNLNYNFGKQHDYWEPRDIENNRFFTFNDRVNSNVWISSDYNKKFALDANIGFVTLFDKDLDYFGYWYSASPRFKLSEKFIFQYSFDYEDGKRDKGYVTTLDSGDIIYGQRDQKTIINSLSGSYNFNTKHALTLTFRNYWSTVTYEDLLYKLELDGTTNTTDGYTVEDTLINNPDQNYDPNENFDIWNLDFKYSWEFAPGSLLTALYRNQLFNSTDASNDSYFDSLSDLFKVPMEHVLSLRLTYYIDYNNLKNVFKGKGKAI